VASSWFFILQLSQWCTVQQTSKWYWYVVLTEQQAATNLHRATSCKAPKCGISVWNINKHNSLLAGNKNVNQSSRFAYKGMPVSEVAARHNSSVNVVCCHYWQFTRGSGFLRMSEDGSWCWNFNLKLLVC